MANTQTGPIRTDAVDKRRGRDYGSITLAELANYGSVGAMRTRLAALSASYTAARLDAMTTNDMEYAIRVLGGDSAGI